MSRLVTRRRALILGIVVIVVVGGWWWRDKRNASQKPVKTYTVTRQDVKQVIVASGEITADRQATLRFPASGKVAYVNVHEGETVRRWQALAGMDTADLAAAETAAFYRYQAADANAKEVEDSVKGHAADETFAQKNDRVTAQASRDIAYDNWLEARRHTRDANLVSPLAGIVTQVTVSAVGASVTASDGVVVVDPASLYFSLEVDESDVGQVSLNQPVEVNLDAYPNATFTGKIERMSFKSSLSDSGATVYSVKVKLAGANLGQLRLGMNGDARIIVHQVKQVLSLPLDAVVDGFVLLPDGKKKPVAVGAEGEDTVEIKSGLGEGDAVWQFP